MVVCQHDVAVGESGIGSGVIGIDRQRLLIALDCLLHGLAGEPVPQEQSLQVGDVSGRIYRTPVTQSGPLIGRHLDSNFVGDRAGDFALQCEDVGETAIVGPCPHAPVTRNVNQLHRDTHSVAHPQCRTLDRTIHTQFTRDFRQWRMRAFKPHCRSARDNPQRGDLREVGNKRIRHSVSKEFLGRVT